MTQNPLRPADSRLADACRTPADESPGISSPSLGSGVEELRESLIERLKLAEVYGYMPYACRALIRETIDHLSPLPAAKGSGGKDNSSVAESGSSQPAAVKSDERCKSLGLNITFSPFDPEVGSAVVSPDEPDGPYWTLIAQGGEDEQNAVAAEIVRRLNAADDSSGLDAEGAGAAQLTGLEAQVQLARSVLREVRTKAANPTCANGFAISALMGIDALAAGALQRLGDGTGAA